MASLTSPAASKSRRAPTLDEISARPSPLQRVVNIWRYRELLGSLVRKELKVKYKNSVLGFVWSLLNPALYLVVFYIVFQYFLQSAITYYAIFLLAGLLPWNLFNAALGASTASITGNAGLVTKVWFPREILPLASIGAAIVHFLLQMVVLCLALVVFRFQPGYAYLPLIPFAVVALLLFVSAVAIALSAINVYLRDTEHLLELALLAWFWMTPVVYAYMQVAPRLGSLFLLNPLTPVVLAFQRAIYNTTTVVSHPKGGGVVVTPILPAHAGYFWYARNLGLVCLVSIGLLFLALHIFGRLEANLAEEI